MSDSTSGTTSYSANNLNQYTSIAATTPAYDSNGNLANYGSATYTYDASSRLVSAAHGTTTAAFAYDARNRQVSRTIDGVTTYLIYDRWNLIAEYDASGMLQQKYIYGPHVDEILAKIDSPGNAVYYHHDGLGSTVALTSGTGALLESYQYDAFGNPLVYNGNGSAVAGTAHGNRFMFSGREYLAQFGLYDYRNRFYSPELGRFVQKDPLRFAARDANIYRYVGNNSVNAIDPSGLWGGSASPGGGTAGGWGSEGDCDGGSDDDPFEFDITTGVSSPLPTLPEEPLGEPPSADGAYTSNIEADPFGNVALTAGVETQVFHGLEYAGENWLSGAGEMASRARIAGGIFFGVETFLAGVSIYNDPSPANVGHQIVNTAVGASAFTPIGPIPSALYFGVEETVGWGPIYHGIYDGPSPTYFNGHPMVRGNIVNPLEINQ